MDKIWLSSYPKGVPETIDPDSVNSLTDFLTESVERFKDKPCYVNLGHTLSYAEVDKYSRDFAAYLQDHLKLKKGAKVAIMLPNVLQYPIAMFGILRAGMTVINVNPLYTARELDYLLKDSEADCIVVLANFAHVLEEVMEKTNVPNVIVTEIGDLLSPIKGALVNFVVKKIKKMVPDFDIPKAVSFKKVMQLGDNLTFQAPSISGEDVAYLQYTGGTTGVSKGAMLTHRNMVANVLQASAWIAPLQCEKLSGGIITALPLYHIFSLTANCLTFLRIGIPNILITNPRDIPDFIKTLKRHPFSVMTGVNTLFNALLNHPGFAKLDFSQFKLTLGGGMSVQRAVAEKWKKVTGVPLIEAYGLTETAPAATINPMDLKDFNGSIGLPISSTEVKVCDEQNKEVPLGEAGELCIRGPQVMRGYWNAPDKTKEILSDDGWLKTGDIATIDQKGFVYIVDRKKDVIIVSGFNVYPNEVENVLAGLSGVKEVAVVGVSAGEKGEMVKAFIVKSDPSLTEDKIIQFCQKQLTRYKIPKRIEFRDELPKTNVGKVLRRVLKG